ncbi:hypothetical protein [Streptococcus equi]|nr:hypothetical protein [Streptococcus equi]
MRGVRLEANGPDMTEAKNSYFGTLTERMHRYREAVSRQKALY